ncbi:bifunctional 2-polyprenyl-6-hydroxyphenol methylase/3-demethylubiquinol 3-O-methyltransferase UbiG [Rossellomorea aquimaris]|uniref:Methyltransferase family protein n=1 Tax=Rossellomorea aquimaris TaxID=189382 RepID=A0A366EK09_9BACI|nr:class I SAM-dependent methyltransferase [Rossellomorea aquimaris]RBP02050.1 methyltransferase family protein [Rossellomorea aquimaris]
MLKDTGERVIPDQMKPSNGLLLEHLARYQFSLPFVTGRVLDLASGSGYGAQFIAKKKKEDISEVIGLDADEIAVRYARGRYFHPKVAYYCEDAADPELSKEYGTFDTIVSFETIEHIKEEKQFLFNLYQLLRPGGTLLLSTPFGKGRGVECGSPFHVHQLTVQEFYHLFNGYPYERVEFYFQHGVLIEPAREDRCYPLGIAVCKKKKS